MKKHVSFDIIGEPNYKPGMQLAKGPVRDELLRKAKVPKFNYYFNYSSPGQLSKLDTLYPQTIEMTSEEISMFEALSDLAFNGGFKLPKDNPLYAINSNQVADGFEKMFKSKYYQMAPDVLKLK